MIKQTTTEVWHGWQGLGYGSIIYLSALSSVDQELYEAARVDGANRWQQLLHVTIPGISTMIIMMLIMRMGADKILLLYGPANYEFSDVINTYVYRMGMTKADYGLSTAVGLFNSVIGTVLLITTNQITKKLSGTAMFQGDGETMKSSKLNRGSPPRRLPHHPVLPTPQSMPAA